MPGVWGTSAEDRPGDQGGDCPYGGQGEEDPEFEDFGEAKQALKAADERRESIFAQSVEAQKNSQDVLDKKFAEAFKKAKESPVDERPFREFDLD